MEFNPLREIRITDAADLPEVVWFHDADFVVDEITFDERARAVELVFDQDVRQLPSDLSLPSLREERRRWFGREALVPHVECRLSARHALSYSLLGDMRDMAWGELDDASYDEEAGELRILAHIGPTIRIRVEALDVRVAFSDRIRSFRRVRRCLLAESSGARIDVADVGG